MDAMATFEEIQAHCLAKPGAVEDYPWGDTVWKVKGKIFAAGGSERLTVRATLEEQSALIQLPHISLAAYVGRYGWVTVELADEAAVEHAKELIDRSYELVAKRRKANG
jgi:predicted DNA-binding protein (MmcQ/YjbR family)